MLRYKPCQSFLCLPCKPDVVLSQIGLTNLSLRGRSTVVALLTPIKREWKCQMLQWTAVARFFFFFFFFKSVVTIGLGGSAGAAALNDSKQKFKSHDTIVIVNVSLLWTPAQVTSKSVLFCFIILYLQKFRHIQNTLWKQLDWRARHTLKVSFAKLYNLITKFVILHTLSLFFFSANILCCLYRQLS